MDNSLQELENELAALRPRHARPDWLNQINRELAAEVPATAPPGYSSATNLRSWKWRGWRTAALAAAVALMATVGVLSVRDTSPHTPVGIAEAPATIRPSEAPVY